MINKSLDYMYSLAINNHPNALEHIANEIVELNYTLAKKPTWSEFKEFAAKYGGKLNDDCVSFGHLEFYEDGLVCFDDNIICPVRDYKQMKEIVKFLFC